MYRIGIDLGGTNIAAGLVGEDFEILVKDSLPTQATRPAEQIVDDIALLCRRVCAAAGVLTSDVGAVGIASPGVANHDTGVVEYANNLPFRHFPIAQLLRERFPVERVSVENDANAAAWGEAVAGAARGTDNSVMITLGTGVGGGIIIDHKVYSGSNFAGAELGHIVFLRAARLLGSVQFGHGHDKNDAGKAGGVCCGRSRYADERAGRAARACYRAHSL